MIPSVHPSLFSLVSLLHLNEDSEEKLKAEQVRRHISSAALLIPVALKNYSLCANHFAIITAWVMFCVYSISVCERNNVSFSKNAKTLVSLGMTAIKDSLLLLSDEIAERDNLIVGANIADPIVYRARYTLLLALQSLLWFWCEEVGWENPSQKVQVEKFLFDGKDQLYVWGEAALPQLLLYYWFISSNESNPSSENWLSTVLHAISSVNNDGLPVGLAPPYYDFEAVARHQFSAVLGHRQDPIHDDSFSGRSFYAEALLHLLVRAGRKQACVYLWPNLTKLMWCSFQPQEPWIFCLSQAKKGINKSVQPPYTKNWTELVDEAQSIACPIVPTPLAENRYLLSLFLLLFPYRGTPEVIRWLGWQFDPNWFITPPRVD